MTDTQYIDVFMRQIGIDKYDLETDMLEIPENTQHTDIIMDWIDGYYFPILGGFSVTNLMNNSVYAPIQFSGAAELFNYGKDQTVNSFGTPFFTNYLRVTSQGVPTDTLRIQVIKIFPKFD